MIKMQKKIIKKKMLMFVLGAACALILVFGFSGNARAFGADLNLGPIGTGFHIGSSGIGAQAHIGSVGADTGIGPRGLGAGAHIGDLGANLGIGRTGRNYNR